jgi:hypothetical protein
MEHGLGYAFIIKFVEELSKFNNELENIIEKLSPKLRVEYEKQLQWSSFLEYAVDNAFIDAVLMIDDWIFSIENKIRSESISNIDQLSMQYNGLKKMIKDRYENQYRIAIIFLVPAAADGTLAPNIEYTFNNLQILEGDFKIIVTWQKSESDYPSISNMIESLLKDEGAGNIDPVPEYTRHTLKAFNHFITNDFTGYEYERSTSSYAGENPLTEARHNINELWNINEGFVGVQNGIGGLLRRMTMNKIRVHQFQYTKADMSNRAGWLDIELFNNVTKWLVNGENVDIKWQGKFYSDVLFKIAKDFKNNVFIGIKGGASALSNMDNEKIMKKQWQIDYKKGPTSNWIDGGTFYEIIKEKNVFPQNEYEDCKI